MRPTLSFTLIAALAVHCGTTDEEPLDVGTTTPDSGRADTGTLGAVDTGPRDDDAGTNPGVDGGTDAGTIDSGVTDGGSGSCDDDDFEPNNTPAEVTITFQPDTFAFEGTACANDRDYYAFEHLGGHLHLNLTGAAGQLFPSEAEQSVELDPTFRLALGFSISISSTTGPALGSLPVDRELPAGIYVVQVTPGPTPGPYTLEIEPDCIGDFLDAADPALDELLSRGEVFMGTETVNGGRVVCGGNSDPVVYRNVVDGELRVTISASPQTSVAVRRHPSLGADTDPSGEVPLAAPGDYTITTSSVGEVITIPAAAALTDYVFVFSSNAPTDQMVELSFRAVALTAATNDACSAAVTLVPDAAPVFGHNLLAANDLTQGCDSAGGDVFYRFTLATTVDTEVSLAGGDSRFGASLELYQDPGVCPADLTTLVPIQDAAGRELCDSGYDAHVKARALPAGNYLVGVDGTTFFGSPTSGFFEVSVQTYPGGFPVVCVPGRTLAIPAAGQSANYPITYADLSPNQRDSYPCTDGGQGEELLILLQPTTDVTVTIRTENGYDSILALVPGDCELEPVACNDDVESSLDSELTATLVAGTTYYLYLDAYDPLANTETTTLVISAAP